MNGKILKITKRIFWVFTLLAFLGTSSFSLADELDETRAEKEAKEKAAQQAEQQLVEAKQYEGTLASQLSQMTYDLNLARNEYAQAEASVWQKEVEIEETEANISARETEASYQTRLVEARMRDLYKNSQYSPITYLFLSDSFSKVNYEYVYRLNIIRQDKLTIIDLKNKIEVLNEEREILEGEKTQLAEEKAELENKKVQMEAQEAYINSQIASARSLQSQLASQLTGIEGEISSLSAKEQEILAAKAAAAAASTSVGSKEQDKGGSISKVAPQGVSGDYYSFWSYGFPHRVGMNQYGAYGRALSGQSDSEILTTYYANSEVVNYVGPEQIKVEGYGWISFEDLYLKGIGEMPSSWPMEALKSQAIAARTYALAYIGYANYSSYSQYRNDKNARAICTTQACQVFLGHIKDERWAQAVDETRGQVILSGGVPIMAYYASTAGGATLSTEEVWGGYRSYALGIVDVDGSGKPFDGPSWGNSPWYYKCWGDEPWLSRDQVEDMINASLLPDSYSGQLPAYPNGFSEEEVIQILQENGIDVVDDLKSIDVVVGAQRVESMRIYYGSTYLDLDPESFRLVYNLRSPGTDAIWSSRFDIQTN